MSDNTPKPGDVFVDTETKQVYVVLDVEADGTVRVATTMQAEEIQHALDSGRFLAMSEFVSSIMDAMRPLVASVNDTFQSLLTGENDE